MADRKDDLPETARRDRPLSDAALAALHEAEARRAAASPETPKPEEFNGPRGEEPTRFGDWERKGIVSDF